MLVGLMFGIIIYPVCLSMFLVMNEIDQNRVFSLVYSYLFMVIFYTYIVYCALSIAVQYTGVQNGVGISGQM